MMSKCAPCLSNPCQNNGTCVSDVTGSYHCTCPFGYKVKDRFCPHTLQIPLKVVPTQAYASALVLLYIACLSSAKKPVSSIFPSLLNILESPLLMHAWCSTRNQWRNAKTPKTAESWSGCAYSYVTHHAAQRVLWRLLRQMSHETDGVWDEFAG